MDLILSVPESHITFYWFIIFIVSLSVAVVVAFFVCWAPFHAQRLMTIYIKAENWTPQLIEVQNIIFHISGKNSQN